MSFLSWYVWSLFMDSSCKVALHFRIQHRQLTGNDTIASGCRFVSTGGSRYSDWMELWLAHKRSFDYVRIRFLHSAQDLSNPVFVNFRLGYLPGLIHSLWLIYEKMHAEERFGEGGFICESSSWSHLNIAYSFTILSRYRKRTLRALVLWKWLWPTCSAELWRNWKLISFFNDSCAVLRSDCGFVFLSALVCIPFAKSGCCGKLNMVGFDLSYHLVSEDIPLAKVYLF